jgi:hypothetical protein
MLASFPASMVNQMPTDLGIPNRFKLTPSRFSSSFPGFLRGTSCRSSVLLCLPASQHFLAGVAELGKLLVQTCDDAAAAGQRAGAIFVIVRLAGAALVGGLSNRGSGASDGERENGEA